jgi:RNA polymerase sigma-70 factor, ECF subfamily
VPSNVIRLSDRPTDGHLVEAARAGDGAAKAELYRRYSRMVANTAIRLLGKDRDLDDVIQETFTQALGRLDRLKDPQAFAEWLRRIAVRCAINTIRRRRLLARLGILKSASVQPEDLIAKSAPPDVRVELEQIYQLIESLPAKERAVLILKRVEKLKLQEIADLTGMSVATVKRKAAKAEGLLEKRWGPR